MDSADQFSTILETETNRLLSLCTKWQNILDTESKFIPEEATGQILLAIGKINLFNNRLNYYCILILLLYISKWLIVILYIRVPILNLRGCFQNG